MGCGVGKGSGDYADVGRESVECGVEKCGMLSLESEVTSVESGESSVECTGWSVKRRA